MSSEDVILDVLKSEINGLKVYVDGRLLQTESKIAELRAEMRTMNENVLVNSAKIEAYRDFMSIGFTIMTVIIGFFGFLVTIAPMLREMYRDRKREKTEERLTRSEVQEMITAAISRTLNS